MHMWYPNKPAAGLWYLIAASQPARRPPITWPTKANPQYRGGLIPRVIPPSLPPRTPSLPLFLSLLRRPPLFSFLSPFCIAKLSLPPYPLLPSLTPSSLPSPLPPSFPFPPLPSFPPSFIPCVSPNPKRRFQAHDPDLDGEGRGRGRRERKEGMERFQKLYSWCKS